LLIYHGLETISVTWKPDRFLASSGSSLMKLSLLVVFVSLTISLAGSIAIAESSDSGTGSSAHKELVNQTLQSDRKTCKDCISGISSFKSGEQTSKHVYFLYGAEHLKLKNYYFDIPVVYNDKVKKWMNYFLKKGRPFFIRYTERAGRYAPIAGKILEDHGLPRDLIFLAMAESGFQNNAKSWAKAVGPWQFMPYTGRKFGLKINWYLDERRDPIKATIAASRYLKTLYKLFGSWELAAAGYNAGEGKINRAIKRYRSENFWTISRGRYLKRETKNYVPKIMALAIIGKNLSSFGFKDIDFHEPLDFDEIDVRPNTDLFELSKAVGVDIAEIRRLNPELMRWTTPENMAHYNLRVPVGTKPQWESCCLNKDLSAKNYQHYTIKKSGSVKTVAKKFKVPYRVMAKLNPGLGNRRLKRGQKVKLPFREGQSKRDPMYADLYELPRKSIRVKRRYRKMISRAKRYGKKISNPKKYYSVKKGDTLWDVSRKTGVPLNTIIKSNLGILANGRRMIRVGDKLAIK